MGDIKLTDLIDLDTLKRIQAGFSATYNYSLVTLDDTGTPIVDESEPRELCTYMLNCNGRNKNKCDQCNYHAIERAEKSGKTTVYSCPLGLTIFAIPIVAGQKVIGCFLGGKVLTNKLTGDKLKYIADRFEIDIEPYEEDINKIPGTSTDTMAVALDFLNTMFSNIISMSYGKYMANKANEEVTSVAGMRSNFLANMSHEIRTPMNAVMGMAEMALREDLPPNAKTYVNQIKSSGRTLLAIINDILDFSKIESGKMDIVSVDYEPLPLLYDTSGVVTTKLGENSQVEFYVSVDPTLPRLLYGDNLRIRQILINLVNNGIKFTKKGYVALKIDYEKINENSIRIFFAVKDTGIGIKKEDIKKLFNSYRQVDSKRNRDIEGTGLGLAISQNLLSMMEGNISVTSEYDVGSTFSFDLPQKVVDWSPCVEVENCKEVAALGYWKDNVAAKLFLEETKRLNVLSLNLSSPDRIEAVLGAYGDELANKKIYFFFDERDYDDDIKKIIKDNPDIIFVMLTGFYSKEKSNLENFRLVKKPLSTLRIALALKNHDTMDTSDTADDFFKIDFTAPDAKVLVVDDNPVNLTVAAGLLEPLKMNIITVESGKKAIEVLEKEKIDLVFMDHMMPEMDGIETTRVIRRLYPQFNDMPIIALSANAMAGAREMFLSEGMNDFVSKPIVLKDIVYRVKKWLPADKVINETGGESVQVVSSEKIEIGDLDTDLARSMVGSDKLYFKILREYYKNIPVKSASINIYYQMKNWDLYTIEVHSIKSASRQIGAMGLSTLAADLETAGNQRDVETIDKYTNQLLEEYTALADIIKPFCNLEEDEDNNLEKESFDKEVVKKHLDDMIEAFDNLDMDQMESVIESMKGIDYPENMAELFKKLVDAADNIDVENGASIINDWLGLL